MALIAMAYRIKPELFAAGRSELALHIELELYIL